MNESQQGPFKNFAVPWFPFSVPATLIGILAWLLFWLFSLVLVQFVEDLDGAAAGIALFGAQLESLTFRFHLIEGAPGGRTLFVAQALIALLLWGSLGLAIARCVVLRLTRDDYVGVRDALRFGLRHARTAWLYPLVVGSCILLLVAFDAIIGLLMQLPVIGIVFYLLLPLAFIATALMIVMALTGLFGIGLVSGAIAVEQRGTLDAWGKALNYIFARPIHFLLYLILIKVLLADVMAHYLFGEPRLLHEWTESALRVVLHRDTFERVTSGLGELSTMEQAARWIWRGFGSAVDLFLLGALTAFAFSAFASVFLILRRDVDGIDVSDVELGEGAAEPLPEPVETCAHEPGEGEGAPATPVDGTPPAN